MADKIVIEAEVKSNIGDVSKETKNAAAEFKILGVSLNGVKAGFASAAVTAKGMFGSIKAGLISTGIGAFVVVIGSLIGYLTNTKKGAELLERTLATIGAAVSVITDRIAALGGAVIKFFKGDFKGAAEEAAAAVKNITGEIIEETKATNKLVGANQKLRDSQRALNVETAQSIAQVEQLKLIAEDITKGYKEREKAATQAFNIEKGLEDKRIKIAAEAVELEKERQAMMGKDGVMAEDLDALAELEINLANVRQESAGRQLSLQNFLNGLRNEELAKIKEIRDAEKERTKEKLDLIEEEKEAKLKAIADEKKAADDLYDAQIAQADALDAQFDKFKADEKKRLEDKKDFEIDMANQGLSALATAAGEGTKLAKAAAIAQATISGIQGVQNAFTAANANVAATAGTFGAYPITMAALAGTFAAVNIAKIASGGKPGSSGGGGGAGAGAGGGAPAPQMMSGAFDISGGVAPEATRAYVVTDEMTNSQDQLANIRRRATI